jgi:hypothetical protein
MTYDLDELEEVFVVGLAVICGDCQGKESQAVDLESHLSDGGTMNGPGVDGVQ